MLPNDRKYRVWCQAQENCFLSLQLETATFTDISNQSLEKAYNHVRGTVGFPCTPPWLRSFNLGKWQRMDLKNRPNFLLSIANQASDSLFFPSSSVWSAWKIIMLRKKVSFNLGRRCRQVSHDEVSAAFYVKLNCFSGEHVKREITLTSYFFFSAGTDLILNAWHALGNTRKAEKWMSSNE